MKVLGLILSALFTISAYGQFNYSVQEVTVDPNVLRTMGTSINDRGEVAGAYAYVGGILYGFKWTHGHGVGLGTLGGNISVARDINNSGVVVGEASPPTGVRAFYYTNQMIALPLPPNDSSYAFSVNNRGQVAGFSQTVAYVWNYNNNSLMFPSFEQPIVAWSRSYAINNNGIVVGLYECPPFGDYFHMFLWDTNNDSYAMDLGVWDGWDFVQPYHINGHNVVVGEAQRYFDNPPYIQARGFIWENGQYEEIGTLGGNNSLALSINDAGDIVGASTTGVSTVGFIYHRGVLYDLNSFVSLPGYHISGAIDINQSGQILVMADPNPYRPQREKTFVLTPWAVSN